MSIKEADQNRSKRLTWLITVKGIPGFLWQNCVLCLFCDGWFYCCSPPRLRAQHYFGKQSCTNKQITPDLLHQELCWGSVACEGSCSHKRAPAICESQLSAALNKIKISGTSREVTICLTTAGILWMKSSISTQ